MRDEQLPLDDVKDLAEREMADKRDEMGDEAQTRELYDVPTESAATLAQQQEDEANGGAVS